MPPFPPSSLFSASALKKTAAVFPFFSFPPPPFLARRPTVLGRGRGPHYYSVFGEGRREKREEGGAKSPDRSSSFFLPLHWCQREQQPKRGGTGGCLSLFSSSFSFTIPLPSVRRYRSGRGTKEEEEKEDGGRLHRRCLSLLFGLL